MGFEDEAVDMIVVKNEGKPGTMGARGLEVYECSTCREGWKPGTEDEDTQKAGRGICKVAKACFVTRQDTLVQRGTVSHYF